MTCDYEIIPARALQLPFISLVCYAQYRTRQSKRFLGVKDTGISFMVLSLVHIFMYTLMLRGKYNILTVGCVLYLINKCLIEHIYKCVLNI